MFPLVIPHVYQGEGHPGSVEGGLDDGVGVPHEGEDSPVGGVAGVNIQETGTRGGSYSICYGLYHLDNRSTVQYTGLEFLKPWSLFPRKSLGHTLLSWTFLLQCDNSE